MTIVRKQDGFKNASRRYYIAQVFPPWFVRETVRMAAIACTRVGILSKICVYLHTVINTYTQKK